MLSSNLIQHTYRQQLNASSCSRCLSGSLRQNQKRRTLGHLEQRQNRSEVELFVGDLEVVLLPVKQDA